MKRLEHSRSGEKHSTTSCVSPYTSFVLEPLPACFTTEQRTVEASLFVIQTKIYYKLHYSGVYSDSLDVILWIGIGEVQKTSVFTQTFGFMFFVRDS